MRRAPCCVPSSQVVYALAQGLPDLAALLGPEQAATQLLPLLQARAPLHVHTCLYRTELHLCMFLLTLKEVGCKMGSCSATPC